MRSALATIQLLGFLSAGVAMSAPEFPRLVRDWSGGTIYPWWAVVYVVLGVVASIVSIVVHDKSWAPLVPTAVVVAAAQIAGLGLVAVKHWKPSFGMGGGYAGQPDELVRLAWVVGVTGAVAALSAIAQLVLWRVFPVRVRLVGALLFGGVGALILLTLPYGIAEGDSGLEDLTSLGAFVLIYSAPIGVCVAGTALLWARLRVTAIGSCAVAAAFSASALIIDLSHLHGRPALLGAAVILAAFALGLKWLPGSGQPAPASPSGFNS